MTREDEEITIEIPNIHFEMRHRLCSIHEDRHSFTMSKIDDFLDRVDCSQHIGDMRQAYQLCAFGKKTLKMLNIQFLQFIKTSMTYDNAFTSL